MRYEEDSRGRDKRSHIVPEARELVYLGSATVTWVTALPTGGGLR